ncbi:MAG TPA: winged helix-turn-helix domain-containing protein [Noviherbaspirillum sp.]|uniref:ArsR/SmtB family transcription factor n=1 Tax=Noviherbaspirillum sp. TaxID=1926288 RepID=UPI002D3E9D2F|nr:winged helix-turn-helix domain-containing protein [Noviherbaspirillum sp.]HYD93855.1 winged helix-turn-helix domain-containing protein [Noviherbaspirillum sp.]
MRDGPNIVGIAALIGDHARAEVLTALMTGKSLTATELADIAGVTKQTMSAHLAKLADAALIAVDVQGRHRYYRLADDDVAHLLETLMGVAFRTGAVRLRSSPREPALRKARVCYDHLAGELGVLVYDGLIRRNALTAHGDKIELSSIGHQIFRALGIPAESLAGRRRTLCKSCMDWSERRHHLAGALGAALLQRMLELGWATRDAGSRVIHFSASGEAALRKVFEERDARRIESPPVL